MIPRRLPAGVRPASGRRLAGIEGLRALAAGSIVLVHTWGVASTAGSPPLGWVGRHFPDLSYGVTLFFTLSGFLLYRPFAAALLRLDARPSFTRYLRNRALRILPAYWVILALCAVVLGTVYVRDGGGVLAPHRLTDAGLFARAGLLVQDYQPGTVLTGIGPAWSLAVEVVFYLVLPLLVLVAWKLGGGHRQLRRRVMAALAPALLVLLVGLSGKAVAAYVVPGSVAEGYGADWHSVVERSFVCQADLFTFGMVLAVLHALVGMQQLTLPRYWRPCSAALALGAYAIAARISWTEAQLSYSAYNTLMAFACGVLVALVVLPALRNKSILLRILETRPLIAFGIVSYSVFLWHEPVIYYLRAHGLTFDGRPGFLVNVVVVIVGTLALSTLTYLFVEAPALRLKFSRAQQDTLPSAELQAAP